MKNYENYLSRRKISENNENNEYYTAKAVKNRIKLVKVMKKVEKVCAWTRRNTATFPPDGTIFLKHQTNKMWQK